MSYHKLDNCPNDDQQVLQQIIHDQDIKLDVLSRHVSVLKEHANIIDTELDQQNSSLEKTTIEIDDKNFEVQGLTKKIEKFRKTVSSNLCCLMMFMIVINIILFAIYMKI